MAVRIVFDGANLAFPTGLSGAPDLDRYSRLVNGVCEQLGVRRETEIVTIFDGGFRHRFNEAQRAGFARLQREWGDDRFVAAPAGGGADQWILALAHKSQAVVVSGDLFRDSPHRKGIVLAPAMSVAGSVLIRDVRLLGEREREDRPFDLRRLFPRFDERQGPEDTAARRAPAPAAPPPVAGPPEDASALDRLARYAAMALGNAEELAYNQFVYNLRRNMGSVRVDEVATQLGRGGAANPLRGALQRLPGFELVGSGDHLRVRRSDPWEEAPTDELLPVVGTLHLLGGRAPEPPSDDGARFADAVRRHAGGAPGGSVSMARLANLVRDELGQAPMDRGVLALGAGGREGRFARAVRAVPGVTVATNRSGQLVVSLTPIRLDVASGDDWVE